MRIITLLLLTGLTSAVHAQTADAGALMRQAQQQEAAGQFQAAADTFEKAAAAFHAAGNKSQEATAYSKSASASEKYADQLLGGATAAAPATTRAAAPQAAAPAGRTVAPARAVAARPAAPAAVAAPRVAAPPAGAAPLAGSMAGGKPLGLFFVTKSVLGNFLTLTYYFSPDGMAYEDPVGLTSAELAATPSKSKGRYRVSGKTLSIAWNGMAKPESDEMSMLSGGFGWSGGALFSAVGPFKSASQLVGSFEGGSSTYTGSGGVLSSRSLTFKADGTYTGGGVVSFTNVTERSVADGGSSSHQVGHWRLDGWYLTLTDAQGHTIRDVAYPVGSNTGKISLFNFNGTAYSRH